MSAGDTQLTLIMQQLQRIDAALSKIEGSSAALEKRLPELTAVVITAQQALRVMWRFSSLLRKMGLSEDTQEAIRLLNAVARTAMYTYYALSLLQTGTIYGAIAGVIGLTTVAMSSGDILAGY